MMILRSAAPSPFGRKVRIALSLLGFDDVRVEPTDTMDPRDSVRAQNPLGKIPVLITDDATYYDSRVILEYLDERAGGGKIIPRAAGQSSTASNPMRTKFQALTIGRRAPSTATPAQPVRQRAT